MALLTKKDVLLVDDREYKNIYVKKWGGEVRLRSLSVKEQLDFEKLAASKKNDETTVMELLLISCVDEDGKPFFERDDLSVLKHKNAEIIMLLAQEAMKLNSLNQDDLDNLAKN